MFGSYLHSPLEGEICEKSDRKMGGGETESPSVNSIKIEFLNEKCASPLEPLETRQVRIPALAGRHYP